MTPSSILHPPSSLPEQAALYRRVSTDHQENSLVVQEAINDAYGKTLNLRTVDLEFADEDVSGSVPMTERLGGRALINRLQHGDVKHLITSKQDRLGRDTLDIIRTVRRLWELGITPHFTAEGGAFPRTPQNEMLMEIKASVSQYERNLIRDRVRLTMNHKFNRQELTGKVPYGYDCEYHFADGTKHTSPKALNAPELSLVSAAAVLSKRLVDNPTEQHWIRHMATMRWGSPSSILHPPSSTVHSLNAIAKDLNRRGITTKLGKPWQCGSVDGVLTSRHTKRLLAQASPESKVHSPESLAA